MLTFALISLTAPAMLWGLMLLSLPLMAHLLNRQARKRIVFPTIKLLRESAAAQSRLFQLRRLIVLALRCLAVALIAWAFARPVWLSARTDNVDSGAGIGAVVVVDCSLSTSQQSAGVATFHAIRAAAQRALDSLHSGADAADLVFATARPEAMFGRLSHNLVALRTELERLEPTYERADFPAALALAAKLLVEHAGERKLIIVSDLQATNWRELLDPTAGVKSSGSSLPRNTRITFVDVDNADAGNIALSHPRISPGRPIAGQPSQAIVTISNFADRDSSIAVSLNIDGSIAQTQNIALTAWEQQEVAFDVTLPREGEHALTFSISSPTDALALDNRAFVVVTAVRRLQLVLISDDNLQEPGGSGYFLTRALAPHGDETDRFEVRHIASADVTDENLAGAAAILVGDIGALDAGPALAILDYLKSASGGVIIFCGDGPVQRNCLMLDALGGGGAGGNDGLLPFTPGAARNFAASGAAVRIASGQWQSRFLRSFDERSQLALSQIAFRRILSAVDIKPDARVLLTYDDGTPALAMRAVTSATGRATGGATGGGGGQVVIANFSPSLHASDLGRYGAFVALLQSIVQELQKQIEFQSAAVVGQPLQLPTVLALEHRAVQVRGPDNQPLRDADISTTPTGITVTLARPREPGVYRVVNRDEALAAAAINIDPRESDLRSVDPETLARALQASGGTLAVVGVNQREPMLADGEKQLWNWFILAAMVMLALEMACLMVWRR
jgi:hypothetical protein